MTSKPTRSVVGVLMATLNGLGSLLILAMAVLICADIASRSLFDRPIAGVAEMVSLSIVAIVFLQAGQAVRTQSLARVELFTNFLHKRSPRLAGLLQSVFSAIAVLVFAALVYGVSSKLADAWSSNEHVGVYGLFVAPVWPVYAVVTIGSAAAALQFGLHAWGDLVRALGPSSSGDKAP